MLRPNWSLSLFVWCRLMCRLLINHFLLGSGKTAAFLLPAVGSRLLSSPLPADVTSNPTAATPRVLILAPTRELSIQICGEAKKFCHQSPFRACNVYGGGNMKDQLHDLSFGCDVLSATPGRLTDLVNRGVISLAFVNYLVLDEADRMLDMGFEPQVSPPCNHTPPSPHTHTATHTHTNTDSAPRRILQHAGLEHSPDSSVLCDLPIGNSKACRYTVSPRRQ